MSRSCAGLRMQTPVHSNSIGCPKIFPPSAPVLYWLSHLTCISSLKAQNEQIRWFHKAKKIQIQPTFFSLFLDEFLEIDLRSILWTDLRPVYCNLTTMPHLYSPHTDTARSPWTLSRLGRHSTSVALAVSRILSTQIRRSRFLRSVTRR